MRHGLIQRDMLDAFRRSSALQRLAEERESLVEWLQTQPRKIIPVAEVARVLEVSVRQLWKWIEQGWISTYKRPSEHYQKGISKPGFTRFLRRLERYLELADSMYSPIKRGRPPTARKLLQDAYLTGQLHDGMTAEQCANALGISTDSVLRTLKRGHVRSYKVSQHRYRLGDRKKAGRQKRLDLTAK